MHQREVWVVAAKRTPMGRFQGELSSFTAPQLGSCAIKAVMNDVALDKSSVDELLMGCVLPAGCGQAPARQAALGAGIVESVPCTTINKVCGSGMKTVMLAHSMIQFGEANCVIAGGMESMTNAPYLLPDARQGMRIGHKSACDHMFTDGLADAYEGKLMGVYGQAVADELGFSREQMDNWATMSAQRALNAQQQGLFRNEIAPLDSKYHEPINEDELPKTIKLDKIPKLKPAFSQHGTITAANSSAISDGAAALLLMEKEQAIAQHLKPLAIIKGHASFARKPSEFTLAPVGAIKQLLTKLEWRVDDVDGWEINEAFAVVTQIAVNHFKLDSGKVNVNGGACALGHPLGASGARILVTLIHSLQAKLADSESEKRSLKGVAALCIGGGEATAIAVEIPR